MLAISEIRPLNGNGAVCYLATGENFFITHLFAATCRNLMTEDIRGGKISNWVKVTGNLYLANEPLHHVMMDFSGLIVFH